MECGEDLREWNLIIVDALVFKSTTSMTSKVILV